MRFKVGDKVKVREDLEVGERYGMETFVDRMDKFKGNVITIKETLNSGKYKIEEGIYDWTDEMLEVHTEIDNKALIFKDEHGTEYLDLELIRGGDKINLQICLNEIKIKYRDFDYDNSSNTTRIKFSKEQDIIFKLKNYKVTELKKKMTKEEVEKELGYKIEIVED